MVDKLSPSARSENMRRIKSKGMKPEKIVRSLVHALGYRFRLHSPSLPGRPDIVLARHDKIIEVRGCFWHQHAGCIDSHMPRSRRNYWIPKLQRNRERDTTNLKALRRYGWRVAVIWECETQDLARLTSKLRRFLEG